MWERVPLQLTPQRHPRLLSALRLQETHRAHSLATRSPLPRHSGTSGNLSPSPRIIPSNPSGCQKLRHPGTLLPYQIPLYRPKNTRFPCHQDLSVLL